MRYTRYLTLLACAGFGLLLAACGGGPRPLVLNIQGTPNLNSTDDQGTGNAVVVQIYELNNETNFSEVTLESFWRGSQTALGDELISSRQLLLYPGTEEVIELEPGEETLFIGVAADFRQPDRELWRRVYPVEELRGRQIVVRIGRNSITFENL